MTGLHLKEIQDKVSLERNSSLPKERKVQKVIHQLRIGRSELHGQDPINRKGDEDKKCDNCGAIEDTRHFLLQCPRYTLHRTKMMNEISLTLQEHNIKSEGLQWNITILGHHQDLPKTVRKEIATHIGNYILSTKRFF